MSVENKLYYQPAESQDKDETIVAALMDVAHLLSVDMGYNVIAIYVQGSQNYKLDVYDDNYKSDIDMKAFIVPSLEDLYFEKKVSKTYDTKYGKVEVKDIRLLTELIKKANLTYLELLCTKYALYPISSCDSIEKAQINLLSTIYDGEGPTKFVNRIVKDRYIAFLNALRGTAKQKHDGVFKSTESTHETLLKYGYQPKELHHLYRLYILARDILVLGKFLSDSYVAPEEDRKDLINIKLGLFLERHETVRTAEFAKRILSKIDAMVEPIMLLEKQSGIVDDTSINELESAIYSVVITSIREEK